jgi:hypothetical protein
MPVTTNRIVASDPKIDAPDGFIGSMVSDTEPFQYSLHMKSGAVTKREEDSIFPRFMKPAYERLDQMGSALPENWDGQGAEPISGDTIRRARRILWDLTSQGLDAVPDLCPTPAGAISLEWRTPLGHVNAEVYEDGPLAYFLSAGEAEREGESHTATDLWDQTKQVLAS